MTCFNGWDVAVVTFHEVCWPTSYFTIPHFLSGALLELQSMVFYTIPNDPLPIVRASELAISNGTHQQSKINWPDIPI